MSTPPFARFSGGLAAVQPVRPGHRALSGRWVVRDRCGCMKLLIEEKNMTVGTILLIVVILLLVGAIPTWPYSRGWGYGPSGGLGAVLVIVLVLLLLGVL